MLTIDGFRNEFDKEVKSRGIKWEVKGFYGADGTVYSFGTDTKVLSTVFESLSGPLIIDIAERHGHKVAFAKQTIYPDFTLTPKDSSKQRVAIDVKTTYQRSPTDNIVFTLGSYTSFLRNGTKNILFPYDQYSAHWVVGFVYTRCADIPSKAFSSSKNPDEVFCPYQDVRYFIQEKYRIAGLRPGSGNTANIGSFPTKKIEDLAEGKGPFAEHGEGLFEKYWKNYARDGSTRCATVQEFLKRTK